MVLGHMPFGLHEFVEGRTNYIAFLRDPVKRVVSLYYYFKRRPETVIHEQLQSMSLEEFAQSKLIADVDNGQVRYLCGTGELGVGDLTEAIGHNELEQAKENLKKHVRAVSITERFNESLILLNRSIGWDVLHYRQANVNPNKDKIKTPESTLEIIADCNRFDIALYDFAVKLFEQQIKDSGSNFTGQLHEFEKRNARFNKYFPFFFSLDKAVNIKLNRSLRKLKSRFGV